METRALQFNLGTQIFPRPKKRESNYFLTKYETFLGETCHLNLPYTKEGARQTKIKTQI